MSDDFGCREDLSGGIVKIDIDFKSKRAIEEGIESIREIASKYKEVKGNTEAVVFLSREDYSQLITTVFINNNAPSEFYNKEIFGCRYTRWCGVKFIELPAGQKDIYSNNIYLFDNYKEVISGWGEDQLPPTSTSTPMPTCKPPKQEGVSEYKALKKMLEYFKEKNKFNNISLADFGESKHCSPLKTIDVQELKDYMLTILEKEMNL